MASSSCNDCVTLNPIENVLTSIENMFKPSLLELANFHGVKFKKKMSSEELKNVSSDHLCGGSCFSSTYEGCVQEEKTPLEFDKHNISINIR